MRKSLEILLCVLLCVSCSSRQESRCDNVMVDVKELSPLDHVFDSYRYVRLQTPDSCIIRSINKIVPTDSLLFIKDESTIFVCNYEGRFLRKINRRGHGRGEYLKINDFDVHANKLWILDSQLHKLLSYGFDGTFMHEYKLPNNFHSLSVQPDGRVFLCAQQSNDGLYNYVLYDPAGNRVVNRLAGFDVNNSCVEADFHDFIGRCGDTLVVANRFDHTVYNLTAEDYSPRLTFSFNTDESLPEDAAGLDYFQLMEQTQFKNVVKHPYLYYQNSSRTVLGYYLFDDYGDSYYLTGISRDGEQKTSRLGATVDSDYPYASSILAQYGDELVSFLSAAGVLSIEKHIKSDMFTGMGVSLSDNPIIFFHHIKE